MWHYDLSNSLISGKNEEHLKNNENLIKLFSVLFVAKQLPGYVILGQINYSWISRLG
jgi:hypothetical protein